MHKHFAFGVLGGAVTLCACQWFSTRWVAELINTAPDFPGWRFGLAFAASSAAAVLPGLLAGFISGRRGFLAGALAGALGSVLYGVFSELVQVHLGSIKLNARTWPVLFNYPTIYVYGLVITAAVGGGAGQLLRSNNRWRGP
jgi:hypothetical protein